MNAAPWITITLASTSPRRVELLAQIGVAAEARPTYADEDSVTLAELRAGGFDGEKLVAELALRRARLKIADARPAPATSLVLAADTIVSLDGALLEKPVDADDARRMLAALSGCTHLVHTAVAVHAWGSGGPAADGAAAVNEKASGASTSIAGYSSPPGASPTGLRPSPDVLEEVVRTQVTFAPLSGSEIDAYIESGEWEGVAGAYRIQGLAGAFVTHLEGSYGTVVGLPIGRVYSMIKRLSGTGGLRTAR